MAADIGQTLREARMRQKIDMTEVEAATKIRAKYLRALENEEWDLLPGPTFVKTFLRTYGEYLGLDARLLVEEYRQGYERLSTQDLTPFAPGLGGTRAATAHAPARAAAGADRRGAVRDPASARSTCWAPGATTRRSEPPAPRTEQDAASDVRTAPPSAGGRGGSAERAPSAGASEPRRRGWSGSASWRPARSTCAWSTARAGRSCRGRSSPPVTAAGRTAAAASA